MKYGSIKKTNLSTKLFFFAIIVAVFFFTFSRNTVEGFYVDYNPPLLSTYYIEILRKILDIKNLDKNNTKINNIKNIYNSLTTRFEKLNKRYNEIIISLQTDSEKLRLLKKLMNNIENEQY